MHDEFWANPNYYEDKRKSAGPDIFWSYSAVYLTVLPMVINMFS